MEFAYSITVTTACNTANMVSRCARSSLCSPAANVRWSCISAEPGRLLQLAMHDGSPSGDRANEATVSRNRAVASYRQRCWNVRKMTATHASSPESRSNSSSRIWSRSNVTARKIATQLPTNYRLRLSIKSFYLGQWICDESKWPEVQKSCFAPSLHSDSYPVLDFNIQSIRAGIRNGLTLWVLGYVK